MQLSSILSLFALLSLSVFAVPEPSPALDVEPVARTLKPRDPLPVPDPKGGKGGGGGGEEEEEEQEQDDEQQTTSSGSGPANASGAGRNADLSLGLVGVVGAGVVVGGILGW